MGQWTRYRGGRGWKIEGSHILAEAPSKVPSIASTTHPACGYLYRTKGSPASMQQLLRDFGLQIEEAADREFDLPIQMLTACIGIEASRRPEDLLRFDPRSVRTDPGYRSDHDTPDKVSPGLMPISLSTAADMLPGCPWLEETRTSLSREDLFVPRYSISLGAAYIVWQMGYQEADEPPGRDPVLNAVAAYNAGSVRYDPDNDWHLLTYSPTRIDRYIAWYNDTVEVLGL